MRSLYSKDEMLLAVAKKKPRLQSLIDDLDNLTTDQINNLQEPLWIKEALTILKSTNGIGQKERLDLILENSEKQAELVKSIPPKTYEVRIWDGSPEFIGTDLGHYHHSWKIEVDSGDSFMLLDDEQVRFGDSVIRVDEWNRHPLMLNSNFVGYMTLDNYRGFHKALLNQKHKL